MTLVSALQLEHGASLTLTLNPLAVVAAHVLLLPPDAGTLRSNQSSAATRARRLTLFTRRMLSGIRSIPEVRGPKTLS